MPAITPTEEVLNLRQQGLSNNQITEILARQGYATSQILDAMNQADIRARIAPMQLQRGDRMPENQVPPMPPPGFAAYPQGPMPPPVARPPMPSMMPEGDEGREGDYAVTRIEELAEAIIDEKWAELVENINRIIDWKEKTEARIASIETEFKNLKENFDKLQGSVLEKVGEYDRHIQDVGTEVAALEKVFQKVLPGFVENVAQLSRITETMKKQAK
ncbi:hypothetical protein HY772_04990 [Candidatus Woesearchaeota archaeon]|nr:hypothetical protein [Candidatus Woesearchaeota archaeon]